MSCGLPDRDQGYWTENEFLKKLAEREILLDRYPRRNWDDGKRKSCWTGIPDELGMAEKILFNRYP
jgi:hypothetical protein